MITDGAELPTLRRTSLKGCAPNGPRICRVCDASCARMQRPSSRQGDPVPVGTRNGSPQRRPSRVRTSNYGSHPPQDPGHGARSSLYCPGGSRCRLRLRFPGSPMPHLSWINPRRTSGRARDRDSAWRILAESRRPASGLGAAGNGHAPSACRSGSGRA